MKMNGDKVALPKSLAASFLSAFVCWNAIAANPDPIALLQGVEAARMEAPPSRLHISYLYSDPIKTVTEEYSIDFQGDRRRFVVKGGTNTFLSTAFDGAQFAFYDSRISQASVRDVNDQSVAALFDPRLLGITPNYSWGDTFQYDLPYKTASDIETIGQEAVGNVSAWHVRLTGEQPYKYQDDLWIDIHNAFRVYRYERLFNDVKIVNTSYFENTNYVWLPSRVEGEEYNTSGIVTIKRLCTIIDAQTNITFSKGIFSYLGLEMPVGTPVIDRRIHSTLGYWNGKNLGPRIVNATRISMFQVILLCFLVLLAVGGLLLDFTKKRKR